MMEEEPVEFSSSHYPNGLNADFFQGNSSAEDLIEKLKEFTRVTTDGSNFDFRWKNASKLSLGLKTDQTAHFVVPILRGLLGKGGDSLLPTRLSMTP